MENNKTRQTNFFLHFHPHFHLYLILLLLLFTYFLTVSSSIISLDGDYVVDSSRLARSSQKDDPDDPNFYRECSHGGDCPINYCCTVGMQRYTKPFCSPLGKLNGICRPDNSKQNFSLSFPQQQFTSFTTLEVTDSYLILCPCADGLECARVDVGQCLPSQSSDDDNSSNDESFAESPEDESS